MTDNFAMAAAAILPVLALALTLPFRALITSGALFTIRDRDIGGFAATWLAGIIYAVTLINHMDALNRCLQSLASTRHDTSDVAFITSLIGWTMFVLVALPSLQVLVTAIQRIARWFEAGRPPIGFRSSAGRDDSTP